MIPKIIHQTWKNREIPAEWYSAVQACKTLHPDYDYILWTDETMEAFVQKAYPWFYPTYQNYKHPIQRCDAFRYLVLATYGGIYLDMDIVCKQKLDPLLTYDLVLAKSSNITASYTNSFFMCVPQHPFMRYCIDHLTTYKDSFSYFGKHMHIMNSTGPMFTTKMLSQYDTSQENTYVLSQPEFAGDCNTCNENKCSGGIYFTHVKGKSWHSWDSTIYDLLLCHYKWLLLALLGGLYYKSKLRIKFKKLKKK